MRLLNFIMFFQYFDSLESGLLFQINQIKSSIFRNVAVISDYSDLIQLESKLDILKKIEKDLSQFFVDM